MNQCSFLNKAGLTTVFTSRKRAGDAAPSALVSSARYQTAWWCVVVRRVAVGSAAGCCGSRLHPDGTDSEHIFISVSKCVCILKQTYFDNSEQVYLRLCSEWGNACWRRPNAQRAHSPAFLDSFSPRSLRQSSAAAEPPAWGWPRGTSPAAPEDAPPPAPGRAESLTWTMKQWCHYDVSLRYSKGEPLIPSDISPPSMPPGYHGAGSAKGE